MTDVLALVAAAIDTAKKLRAVAEKIKDAEARNLVADLSISLADLKIEIASLKEENLHLQTELKEKTAKEKYSAQIVARDGMLYFKDPPEDRPAGPYCPNCKENDGKLILVNDQRRTPLGQIARFRCPACHSNY